MAAGERVVVTSMGREESGVKVCVSTLAVPFGKE